MKKSIVLLTAGVLSTSVLLTQTVSAASLSNSLDTSSHQVSKIAQVPQTFKTSQDIPWESTNLTLEEDGTLHLPAGNYTNPEALGDALDAASVDRGLVKKIAIDGSIVLSGNVESFFNGFSNLISIEGLPQIDTSSVTDMSSMFASNGSLSQLDLSSFNTSNVTNMSALFNLDGGLTSLDLSHFDTSKVTDMNRMFNKASALTALNLSAFNTSKVNNMSAMFNGMSGLSSLDLSSFDTSSVTDMSSMLSRNTLLTTLNLSHFDTSKVTNMSAMFYGNSKLNPLKLDNFNTSNVLDMSSMFNGNTSLKSLDLSHFNTAKVTNMSAMFYNCSTLSNLNLNHFDTFNVENMSAMFSKCGQLTAIDLSTFNTAKVDNMADMFSETIVHQLKLGSAFSFMTRAGDVALNDASKTSPYTGKWQNVSTGSAANPTGKNIWTATELIKNYKGTTDADTYVWQKAIPVAGGNITVKYVDGSGKTIASSDVLKGNVGDKYTSTKKTISGYTYQKTVGNAIGTFTIKAQTVSYVYTKNVAPVTKVAVYRAYNPNSGEHVYTTSKFEYDSIIKGGWKGEGMQWNAPSKGTPIYRAYNPNSGEHFYTASSFEYDSLAKTGWKKEGVAFYSDASKGTPIYRAFNPNATGPGSHFYTTSAFEYNTIATQGWKKEGIAFFALSK